MCEECYNNLEIRQLIIQLKQLRDIGDDYDFSKWNTTSLSFVYLFIIDSRLECYHNII